MLSKFFKSVAEKMEESRVILGRSLRLENLVMGSFPDSINARLSVDDIGTGLIRAFIYLDEKADEETTKRAVGWLALMPGFSTPEKTLRPQEGYFIFTAKKPAQDDDGNFEFMVLIEHCHQGKCKIIKKLVTVERFESDCSEEAAPQGQDASQAAGEGPGGQEPTQAEPQAQAQEPGQAGQEPQG